MLCDAGFMSRGPSGLPLLDSLRQPLRSLLRRCAPCVKRQDGTTIYQGHGQPVMVFPVLGGGPDSTAPLRGVLDQAGFISYDWGMGANTGPRDRNFNRWLRELEEKWSRSPKKKARVSRCWAGASAASMRVSLPSAPTR